MFLQIKERLKIEQVVRYYGVKIDSKGKALCPFHNEKTASFEISNELFFCHGCNKGGDSIKFVSFMFGLKSYDACKKINEDFRLGLGGSMSYEQKKKVKEAEAKRKKELELAKKKEEQLIHLHKVFTEYEKICIEEKPFRGEEPNNLWKFANEMREFYWERILAEG